MIDILMRLFDLLLPFAPLPPRPRVYVLQGHGQPSRVIVENRGTRPFTVLSVRSVSGGQLSPSGMVVPPHESAAFVSHAHFDVVYVQIAGMKTMTCFPDEDHR